MHLTWDQPNPFLISHSISADEIDGLNHANNVSYLRWLERCAWAHSESLGLPLSEYQRLDRAMIATRHELDYLAAGFLGDELQIATWITGGDSKLRLERRYQIIRTSDGITLLRGRTDWVCCAISNGKPKRMPAEFIAAYTVNQT